ncbi:uncharacterized protein LOC101741520 isoform X2 [Bombyx mori]
MDDDKLSSPTLKVQHDYHDPDNVHAIVPGTQELREVDGATTSSTSTQLEAEIQNGGYTVTRTSYQEISETVEGIKTTKTTVTLSAETNQGKETTEDTRPKTRIPKLKFRQAAERLAAERRRNRQQQEKPKLESLIPVAKSSTVKRSRFGGTPALTAKPVVVKRETRKLTDSEPDDEFEKIYEEIANSASEIDTNILDVRIEDPENLESKFEEIVHDYDENRIQPIRIPKFPRRLTHRTSENLPKINNERIKIRNPKLKELATRVQDDNENLGNTKYVRTLSVDAIRDLKQTTYSIELGSDSKRSISISEAIEKTPNNENSIKYTKITTNLKIEDLKMRQSDEFTSATADTANINNNVTAEDDRKLQANAVIEAKIPQDISQASKYTEDAVVKQNSHEHSADKISNFNETDTNQDVPDAPSDMIISNGRKSEDAIQNSNVTKPANLHETGLRKDTKSLEATTRKFNINTENHFTELNNNGRSVEDLNHYNRIDDDNKHLNQKPIDTEDNKNAYEQTEVESLTVATKQTYGNVKDDTINPAAKYKIDKKDTKDKSDISNRELDGKGEFEVVKGNAKDDTINPADKYEIGKQDIKDKYEISNRELDVKGEFEVVKGNAKDDTISPAKYQIDKKDIKDKSDLSNRELEVKGEFGVVKGKVARLAKLDSEGGTERKISEQNCEVPKKKSILSKIALFERQDVNDLSPKRKNRPPKIEIYNSIEKVHVHTPKIVDEVLKPVQEKINVNVSEIKGNVVSTNKTLHNASLETIKKIETKRADVDYIKVTETKVERATSPIWKMDFNAILNNSDSPMLVDAPVILPSPNVIGKSFDGVNRDEISKTAVTEQNNISKEILTPVHRNFDQNSTAEIRYSNETIDWRTKSMSKFSRTTSHENNLNSPKLKTDTPVPNDIEIRFTGSKFEFSTNRISESFDNSLRIQQNNVENRIIKEPKSPRIFDRPSTEEMINRFDVKKTTNENKPYVSNNKDVKIRTDIRTPIFEKELWTNKSFEYKPSHVRNKDENYIKFENDAGRNYHSLNNNLNVTKYNDESVFSSDKNEPNLCSVRHRIVDVEKRSKSLADSQTVGKANNSFLSRMKSVDRFENVKRDGGVKDLAGKLSVSERIALFERKITSVKMEESPGSGRRRLDNGKQKRDTRDLTDEQYKTRVAELNEAKLKGSVKEVATLKLRDGTFMPVIALGTALLPPRLATEIVETAIDMGYRAIDTAYIYGNEKLIGKAIKNKIDDGTVRRDELFIMGKLWSTFHRTDLVETACRISLADLGLEFFDLFLIHNPMSLKEGNSSIPKISSVIQYSEFDYMDAWFGMEDLVAKGLAKNIGVSNFNSTQIQKILDKGKVKPAVNQVECHPYLTQQRLHKFCEEKEIILSCFSVLGSKGTPTEYKSNNFSVIDDPLVQVMASGLGITPAQLLIKYQIQCGHNAIVKASTGAHLWDNLQALNVDLTTEHINALNALNKNKRTFTFVGMGETHKNYPFLAPF